MKVCLGRCMSGGSDNRCPSESYCTYRTFHIDYRLARRVSISCLERNVVNEVTASGYSGLSHSYHP
jgi:hypothetical protein